jgi:exosortase A-associated hydrolase 2
LHTTDFQYLPSSLHSQIFIAHYAPLEQGEAMGESHTVIFVPPFAEEMNRSKRMYVLCARLLADAGIQSICFDFAGTGDSSGEWGDFNCQDWKNNLIDVYQYANKSSSKISLVTLRDSALISLELIKQAKIQIYKCVLWDPIDSGEVLIRQLMRMKIASAMADDLKKVTTQEVLDSIEQSGFLEVAGYHVSSSLIDSIKSQRMSDSIESALALTELHWMTTGKFSGNTKQQLPISLTKLNLTEDLLAQLNVHPVNDVKFWMQQEVTISPLLLRETKQALLS